MEFLRFGSSIPGSYWGCCAVDIIQFFKVDPDTKASIGLVYGDGGSPILTPDNQPAFLGTTYREIFLQRLRMATFNGTDMPNHTFYAVLTAGQLQQEVGKKWLAILKEQGFEFVRAVDNSVYTGAGVNGKQKPHLNYIFALYRNVGAAPVEDQFTPPAEWTDLPSVVPEPWQFMSDTKDLTSQIKAAQLPLYKALPKTKMYTEKELEDLGVPVTYAGKRSPYPQQSKAQRLAAEKREALEKSLPKQTAAPFAKASSAEVEKV